MPLKQIFQQLLISVVAITFASFLIWLLSWASDGGLLRTIGGVTKEQLTNVESEHYIDLQGEPGLPGLQGEQGEQGERGIAGTAVHLPNGAVVAFYLSDGCPEGWEKFNLGAGRFIVGVGRHNKKDQYGKPIDELEFGEQGGGRKHKLSKAEMPKHTHEYIFSSGKKSPLHNDTSETEFGLKDESEETTESGKNLPHNNMPPFLALHYCVPEISD